MAINRRDFIDKLEHKFLFEKQEKTDHIFYVLRVDGKVICQTLVSRGGSHKIISDQILSKVSKQLKVNNTKFLNQMFECTKSRQEYLDLLRANDYLR